jgi:hypothetical protein
MERPPEHKSEALGLEPTSVSYLSALPSVYFISVTTERILIKCYLNYS